MDDLDDDEGRRLEEQLRTKVHKANFWAYPPEHQRDPAEGARPQDPGRNFHGPHQQVPGGIQPPVPGVPGGEGGCGRQRPAAGRCIRSLAEWSNGRTQGF